MTAVLKIAEAFGLTLTELFREVESNEEPETEPPEISKGRPPKTQERRNRAQRSGPKKK